MKKNARILALLLALLMVLSVTVSSCGTDSGTVTPVSSSAEVDNGLVNIIKDGAPLFSVIRSDKAENDSKSVEVAKNIKNAIAALTSSSVKIGTDYIPKGQERDSSTYEILIGITEYKESTEVVNTLRFGDYAIKLVGNKIVVISQSDAGMAAAETAFYAILAKAEKSEDGKTVTLKKTDIDVSGVFNEKLSSLPAYENGTFNGTYTTGNGCTEMFVEKTTKEACAAYVEKLKAAGYTVSRTNEVKENVFTTLNNDKTSLNVMYIGFNNTVKIVSEPFSQSTLFGLEKDNNYEVVTTTQLTMLGLQYTKADGSEVNNGMSILIRLADGRFVVIDGGFNNAAQTTEFIKEIKEQSKDYASKTGIKIAAWIVTHAHGDHTGMFNAKESTILAAGIEVQNVIAHVASNEELERAINSTKYADNWSANEGNASDDIAISTENYKAQLVTAHVGQIYHIANLDCEVLYTIETYAPQILNAFNTTSVVMKMTFTDPTTKEKTVYISNGDATGPALSIVCSMYGDYLKADITQVAHHGYTTWSLPEATKTSYKLETPATVLFPVGYGTYATNAARDYNAVLLNTETNPNYAETYMAGYIGEKVILPMPYKVGSAIVVRK